MNIAVAIPSPSLTAATSGGVTAFERHACARPDRRRAIWRAAAVGLGTATAAAITAGAVTLLNSGAAGAPAVLELADYAPLPLREPVRSLVWIRGRLHQVWPSVVSELLDLIATLRSQKLLQKTSTTPQQTITSRLARVRHRRHRG